ncbi:MAG: hypothetical protein AAGB29_05625 [Planctomycetota bacterium]
MTVGAATPHCPHCGYDLRSVWIDNPAATHSVCPECGERIDLDLAATVLPGPRLKRWQAGLIAFGVGLVVMALGCVAIFAALPGGFIVLLLGGPVVGLFSGYVLAKAVLAERSARLGGGYPESRGESVFAPLLMAYAFAASGWLHVLILLVVVLILRTL